MPETPWGPDAVPHALEEFEAPASAGAWTLQDSVVADATFAAAPAVWTQQYWGSLASMLFDAEAGGANGTATPAGVSSVSAVGTALATGDATASPVGVSTTAAVGTAVVTGQAVALPAGVGTVSSVGTASATGDATASPAGVQSQSAVGDATAIGEAGGDATATPLGVATVASVGAATATGDAIAFPLGVSTTAAVGTATAIGEGGEIPITEDEFRVLRMPQSWGIPAKKVAAKKAVVRVDAVARPRGVESRSSVGIVGASGDATAYPKGVATRASVGQVEVLIGPNLIVLDDDEVLLLLESAA